VEERAGGGKADYALLGPDGSYLFLIEAKKASQKLPPVATTEVIKYASLLLGQGKRVERLAVTNGLLWEFYSYPGLEGLGKLDLNAGRPEEAALQLATRLWRELFVSMSTVSPAVPEPRESVSLAGIARLASKSRLPKLLMLPGGTKVNLASWKHLLIEVVRYCLGHGLEKHLPVSAKQAKGRDLVSLQPVHPNGKPFRGPVQVGPVWIETYLSARDCVRAALRTLEVCGLSPAEFRVVLA